MPCTVCAVILQVAANAVMLLDLTLNFLLLGNPKQTVSQRAAIARARGSRPAAMLCAVLTFITVRLLRQPGDHCDWSIDPKGSSAADVWQWGPK